MQVQRYEALLSRVARAKLKLKLKLATLQAEKAWKANRKAIRSIDIDSDGTKGEVELDKLLVHLKLWIIRMEMVANAANRIEIGASQAIHSGGYNIPTEEDGQGYGPR